MSSQSDTNTVTLTHNPVSQRDRSERGEVVKTWDMSNKADHRNRIGQIAKTETKKPAPNSGQGMAYRNAKINPHERKWFMQKTKQSAHQQPQQFRKRIGKSYYDVVVHFSDTSKENINDKITRLIRNEVVNAKAAGQ